MNERLLQFIWQFQYFNRNELHTETGEELQVIYSGRFNTNQGPDFLEAKIKIEDTLLAGNIELHLKSSDWEKHRHQNDKNYSNIILHVVWEDDRRKKHFAPTFVLQHRVSKLLLQQYNDWMQQVSFIACSGAMTTVKELVWIAWKERLLAERLQRKSEYVLQLFASNNNHWEETFWQLLAKNFGMKVNGEAFEAIAKSLPVTILAKHKNQLTTLEALLLGQAGLLEGTFNGSYPQLLQREYRFCRKKYKLAQVHHRVQFFRMRPAAFPAIRLAQLAMLIYQSVHLFTQLKETTSVKEAAGLLNVAANDYWHYHYQPDEPSGYKKKTLGNDMVNNILINTVVPVFFAYGMYHNEQSLKDKSVQWLQEINAESNAITRGWQLLHREIRNAYDSQSLIELKNQYCDKKRCLDCSIGNALLKKIT